MATILALAKLPPFFGSSPILMGDSQQTEADGYVPAGTLDNSPAIYRWDSGCRSAIGRAIGVATQWSMTEDEIKPRPCFDLVCTPTNGWT